MTRKFSSKIFIDGGVPGETREAKKLLGYLDGQTTNPTLIARNLKAKMVNIALTPEVALEEYRRIVMEMSKIIPDGSISIQVFADKNTKAEEMLHQARERAKWISNASIKFPCTHEGLKAAEIACREFPINITLVFSQSQAAAVYEATKEAKYPVFISPFVGRLDDRGENGMDIVANIIKMYEKGDGHVEVLTASVRNVDHILYASKLRSNIITIPFKVFKSWADTGFRQPKKDYVYSLPQLKNIPYEKSITLGKNWQSYDLHHELTDKGVAAFWTDWTNLFTI
jgi:transaldolase